MKSLYQFAILLFMVNPVWAAADAIPSEGYVEVSPAQRMAYDSQIVDAKKSTLIILPGIFRGLNRSDKFIQQLVEKKINFVTINFSTQPASVANYDEKQKTYFDGGKNVTSKKFADEVEAVVDALDIKKPLVVTLSYSGSVSQFLNPVKFPVLIETSPLGRYDEDPDVKALNFVLPWFREYYLRQWADKTAAGYVNSDPRLDSQENRTRMSDGYIAMAKAVETYDMSQQNFATSPRRVFIFGENEQDERKANQLAAVEVYKKTTGIEVQPIIVKGAGHIVPNDEPEQYIQLLSAFLNKMDEKAKTKKK